MTKVLYHLGAWTRGHPPSEEHTLPDTYLLIPGAWHGGWAWRPVAAHLRAAGHRVVTPTLPGLADGDDPSTVHLEDAVDSIVKIVEDEDLRDVVMVGHSWGGYPLTGAAPRVADRLVGLIYWSAFVPAEGRSLMDEVPPDYVDLFEQMASLSGGTSISLPLEVFQQAFMNDAGAEAQRLVHRLLVPQPLAYFTETVAPLDRGSVDVPVRYVLSTEDGALPPGEFGWRRFAERLGVDVEDAPGSHEACFTQPDGLAQSLMR